jgi:hypothetical protein
VAPALVAVLALVVWAIYVADRLLDARAGCGDAGRHGLQERHWFHWRHRRVLSAAAGIAAATACGMVLSRLHAAALGRDSLMGVATLAYFSGVHGRGAAWMRQRLGRFFSRELAVGILFSAGCLAPVLPSAEGAAVRILAVLAAPAAAFAALAWLNVKAIGCWESNAGPESGLKRCAGWLAALCCALAVWLGGLQPRIALLLVLVAVSSLLLAWLDGARKRMDALTLRAAADLVLLTPVLLAVRMELAR